MVEKIIYPVRFNRELYDKFREKTKEDGTNMHRFLIEAVAEYTGFQLVNEPGSKTGYSQSGKKPPGGNRAKPFRLTSPKGEVYAGENLSLFIRENRDIFGAPSMNEKAILQRLSIAKKEKKEWKGWKITE